MHMHMHVSKVSYWVSCKVVRNNLLSETIKIILTLEGNIKLCKNVAVQKVWEQAEDGTQQMYVDLEYKQILTRILPVGVAITYHT